MDKEKLFKIINIKYNELKEAFKCKDIDKIKDLALEVHAMVHPAEISGLKEKTISDYVLDFMIDGNQNILVPREDCEVDLHYAGTNVVPICWQLWHIYRIEDLVSNILMRNKKQIFNLQWKEKIGSIIEDTGNALELDEAIIFGKGLNVKELRDYIIEVGKNTREIIRNLTLEEINSMVPVERIMRILEVGGVTTDFRSIWLLVYWGRLTIGEMILTPLTDHHMMHLPPCINFLNAKLLTGGRSTYGIVRVNDIVFRPHKAESKFVNTFLKYLEVQGFLYSQRYIGQDEQGRDMFKYIDGFVPAEIGETSLQQLCNFMKIVRMLHDISCGFTKNDKVICHNDLSPCNTVFVKNEPIAIIDWDSASIGERWEDITYILWLWINIGSLKRDEIDILEQMKTALSFYGIVSGMTYHFADKLIWRMDKVIMDMDPKNYQYKRTKDWVSFSKLWVEQNRQIITKEIG